MIVLDASVMVEVLLRTNASGVIESRIFDTGETLHAPHLIDVEVTHVLRRYTLHGNLDPAIAKEALVDLGGFPIARYPHTIFLERIWDLRANLSAYDSTYVALSEGLDATLLTRDRRLAASPVHNVVVECI